MALSSNTRAATDTSDDVDQPVQPDGGRELPSKWSQWPRESKINYLTLGHKRVDLLAHLRGYLGSSRGSPRLDKEEIAMICVDLEVVQ